MFGILKDLSNRILGKHTDADKVLAEEVVAEIAEVLGVENDVTIHLMDTDQEPLMPKDDETTVTLTEGIPSRGLWPPVRLHLEGLKVKKVDILGSDAAGMASSAFECLVSKDITGSINVPLRVISAFKRENIVSGVDFLSPVNLVGHDNPVYLWFHDNIEDGIVLYGTPAFTLDETVKKMEKSLAVKDVMIEISQAVLGIEKLSDLLELVITKTVQMIEGATHGSIMGLDSHQYLNVVAKYGYNDEILSNFRLPLQETFIYKATDGRLDMTSLIIHDGMQHQPNRDDVQVWFKSNSEIRYGLTQLCATISAPIEVNGKFYGCLNIDTTDPSGFRGEDIQNVQYIKNQVQVILENHQLYDQTIYLSRYDKLTEVYNRGYFEEQLAELLKITDTFMMVIFDLSRLKYVNDVYGHTVGDAYLKQFARTLKEYFGYHVLLGRYGGDEFMGVFQNIERNELIRIIEVLYVLFEKAPLAVGNNVNLICRFHYGIAEYPEDGTQLEELVSLAEKNMTLQKNQV